MIQHQNKFSERRFVEGLPPKEKSKVAITTAKDYGEAEAAVRRVIDLLGGIKKFVKPTDTVMIKPNLIGGIKPEHAETTHPAVIEAIVRICKETGASVKVGEQTGWHGDPEMAFEISGIKDAAIRGGADLCNWDVDEYVDVKVPNARSCGVLKLPKSLVEADVIINVPKMKINMQQVVTLGVKSWIGAVHTTQRTFFHKTSLDAAWLSVDVLKALGARHKLNILDGIEGIEGNGPHGGCITKPGVILASSDVAAFNAVSSVIMGFHPLESPATQVAMKDGLGTADLREIEVLGKTIEEVKHPFKRPVFQVVSRYPNVMEFVGGACNACQWMLTCLPPYIDPNKKYAVIAGARAMIAQDLANFDEVYLIGTCACSWTHQLPGFKEKLKRVKKGFLLSYCPGYNYVLHYWQDPKVAGEVYSAPDLLLTDMVMFIGVPDLTNEAKLEAAIARREGKMSLDDYRANLVKELGEDVVKNTKAGNWKMIPPSIFANVDKEFPTPDQGS